MLKIFDGIVEDSMFLQKTVEFVAGLDTEQEAY